MRCPQCGRDNASDALFCSACGASLSRPGDDTDAQISSLMNDVQREVDAHERSLKDALAYETELIKRDNQTRPMDASAYDGFSYGSAPSNGAVQGQTIPTQGGSRSARPNPVESELLEDLDPSVDEEAYEHNPMLVRHAVPDAAAVPSVDATELRPATTPREEHFIVRSTRDYDHDAQSVNTASSTSKFATLRQERTTRDTWFDPYARSARKGDVLGEGNSRSKGRPFLAILLIALVLGAAAGVLTYGMELWGGKRVPYLLGESQSIAEAKLKEQGLVAHVEVRPADDAIGKVIEQDPELGARIPEGGEVTVVIAASRTMPDVVGMTKDEARTALQEAGAELIEIKEKESSTAEGTVLEVKPAAGELFVSRSPVTLTVATPFRVPDVIGKKESDAVDTLKEAGYETEVSYIASEETVRTVVSTEPAAGEVIAEGGTVQVKVSSPYPSDPLHLAEFFDHSSQDVDSYLQKKDFTFEKGYIDAYGNALATYVSKELGDMTFSSQPFVRTVISQKEGSSNVMATGVPIAGVRVDLPDKMIPSGYDKEAANELVNLCGFKGWKGHCTEKSIVVPSGSPKTSAKFVCASGAMGNLIWTVTIVGNGSVRRASVTCAKEGLYPASELAPFDGKVRNYVAYQEAYLSSEFQVKASEKKESSSQDKADKDASKKDGEEGEKKDGDTSKQSSDKG